MEPEKIQSSINSIPDAFYYTPKTKEEIEAYVLDLDLGLPPDVKVLSSDDKANIKKIRLQEVDSYFSNMKEQITTSDDMILQNIRINCSLAINAYNKIKDTIDSNPNIDKDFIRKNMECHVKIRELAIDEMTRRGLGL